MKATGGDYRAVAASPTLAVAAADVAAWVLHDGAEDDNDWARQFRAWVRAEAGTGA